MKTFMATTSVLALIILVISCGKDKFETKPKLEFKSYDRFVDPGGSLTFRINYFDKEGDLSQATIIGLKERLNNFPPPSTNLGDTFRYQLPSFPEKAQGEISFQIDYSRLNESPNQNDTIRFRFAVTDLAGNNSDTITSDIIVARMP